METTNQPKIGQLLYNPPEEGYEFHTLYIVDSEYKEGESWPYTQIALMGDIEENGEIDVYTENEAGMMPTRDAIIAEDSHIQLFIDCLLEKGKEGKDGLEMWIENFENDEVLLPSEKERLTNLINKNLGI